MKRKKAPYWLRYIRVSLKYLLYYVLWPNDKNNKDPK